MGSVVVFGCPREKFSLTEFDALKEHLARFAILSPVCYLTATESCLPLPTVHCTAVHCTVCASGMAPS